MYDKEKMKNIVQKMRAKRDEEETRYADALREISMAYSEIPRFARKMKTLKFRVEGNYRIRRRAPGFSHGDIRRTFSCSQLMPRYSSASSHNTLSGLSRSTFVL